MSKASEAEALQASHGPPEASVQQLDATAWSAAMSYLPAALLEAICQVPGRPPTWIDSVEGTLVFADISGFTRMSERLAETGKEGAERLTDILNSYFHRMLDIARAHRGANLKFGGDALLLLFRGDNHASRAVATALAMQRATKKFPTVHIARDRIHLGMSVGIHSGVFWCAAAGVPELRMQHFILGREASQVAHVEGIATAGEVLISKATLSELGGLSQVEARDDAYRVLQLSRQRADASPPLDDPASLPGSAPELLAFLPPPVAQALTGGDQVRRVDGERRKVAIVFISLLGVNELAQEQGPGVLVEELQRYLSSVIRLTDQYGGFLAGNDIDARGLKLILIFGAPVAHEQDSANALRLAAELNRELPGLGLRLQHRIGVNSGFVFAGDVGAPYRREYTVIGDAVNLSARLMASASIGQIFLSQRVADEVGPGFILQKLAPITVKGKKAPVSICLLEGVSAAAPPKTAERQSILLGREAELDSLKRLCLEVEGGAGRSVVISGEAGMGKSRLVQEFDDYLRGRGWTIHHGQCYSHTAASPYAPWLHILSSLFGVAQEDATEVRTEKVLATIQRLRPDLLEMASLLNALLALSIPQSEVAQSLDDDSRRHRLFDLVTGLLQANSTEAPTVVLLEDLHWADRSSLELINYVGANVDSSRLLMCLTHRPKALQLELPKASTLIITLTELAQGPAVELVRTVLGIPQLPAQVAQALLSKARGNPLFLGEVARSLRQSGALDRVLSAPPSRMAEEMAALDIPDRIQGLIMSRIDALGGTSREVLRTASVIGNTFDTLTLQSLLDPDEEKLNLEARLQELVGQEMLHREEAGQGGSYEFSHALIQEVAYDSLLFARRRRLHHRVASFLEDAHSEQLEPFYEVLVHHYWHSGDNPKTMDYATKAGDKARQVFAHEDAIEYYRQGISALEKMGGRIVHQRSYLMERIGDCYEVSGRHEEAAGAFSRGLREWRKAARQPDPPPAMPSGLMEGTLPKAREAALCRKIGVSYERNSDYDASLKWLGSAQRVLPSGQPLEAAQISIARSVALFRKGLYEEAIRWGRRGLAMARRGGDHRRLAYAHDMLASPYMELGRLKQAIRHDLSAVRLYDEVGDIPGQAVANNNLGSCYQLLGVLDKAIEHYEVSLKAYQRAGNLIGAAIVHNNIGEVFLTQGRLEEAVGHFQEVVGQFERKGDPVAVTGLALVNLCRAHQRQGHHQEALACLERGMGLLRKAGARGLLTEALLQQAELELEAGRSESALRTCQRALRVAQGLGAKLLEARGLRILGRIALAGGDGEAAEADLRRSVDMAQRLGADYEKGLALLYLAQLYDSHRQKGFRQRRAHALGQAVALFRRLGAEGDLAAAMATQAGYQP